MDVVYIDVLILTNFIFHLIALYLTAQITKNPFHLFYCLLSAFLGAVIGAWAVIWCQSAILLLLIEILSLSTMTLLTYKPKRFFAFIRLFIILGTTLFLCGTISFYFLLLFTNRIGISNVTSSDGKILLFTILSAISGSMIAFSNRIFRKQTDKKEVRVTVKIADKCITFFSLADTGCTIKDPISSKSILFIPSNESKMLFRENDYDILAKGDINKIDCLSVQLQKKVRIVPCQTIMGGSLLVCILADEITVDGNKKSALVTIRTDGGNRTGICPASLL